MVDTVPAGCPLPTATVVAPTAGTGHAQAMNGTFVKHRYISSSGHRIHLAEAGEGPLVVLIHGFPESWYSWRHQLADLADAGYRAVALDVRGYGRSAAPADIEAYAMTALVGDVIAVIDDAGPEPAAVVGHDWGAPIAWNTALLRPDRVRGVAGLSVPYNPRGDVRPLDGMRALAGPDWFYIDYFQEPGLAEAEVEADLAHWLKGIYFSISGEADLTAPVGLRLPPRHPDEGPLPVPGAGPDGMADR